MEIDFSCDCGRSISEFTRRDGITAVRIECSGCGAVWNLTLTNIPSGEALPERG
jgi:hypothetical protein